MNPRQLLRKTPTVSGGEQVPGRRETAEGLHELAQRPGLQERERAPQGMLQEAALGGHVQPGGEKEQHPLLDPADPDLVQRGQEHSGHHQAEQGARPIRKRPVHDEGRDGGGEQGHALKQQQRCPGLQQAFRLGQEQRLQAGPEGCARRQPGRKIQGLAGNPAGQGGLPQGKAAHGRFQLELPVPEPEQDGPGALPQFHQGGAFQEAQIPVLEQGGPALDAQGVQGLDHLLRLGAGPVGVLEGLETAFVATPTDEPP